MNCTGAADNLQVVSDTHPAPDNALPRDTFVPDTPPEQGVCILGLQARGMTAVRFRSKHWGIAGLVAAVLVGCGLVLALSRQKEAVEVWAASATYADLSQE